MSGFEVAGIALAVFPILVDGMERFVTGVQTIKYWRRYRVRLQDYADIMETQRIYYQDTLEELLTGIVQSEDEIKDLMELPRGAIWKRAEYEERLSQRLGRSHAVYLKIADKMVNALGSMCEKLGIDSSGKLLPDDSSRVEQEMKRIKITLSKNIYREILDTIDKANKQLREITHQNICLEPVRQKRRSKRPLAQLKVIRKHATSLYQVLIAGTAWKCSCRVLHLASLRLESRTDTFEAVNSDTMQRMRFRILLSTRQEDENLEAVSRRCEEIDIIPTLEYAFPGAINVGPQHTTRNVRFGPDPLVTATEKSLPEITIGQDCQSIADICSTLCASYTSDQALGFLVDEKDSRHKHYLYRADATIVSEARSKSLGDLLSHTGHGSHSTSLSRNDRLRIAVTLASSVLQLYGTSWLEPQWRSKDIIFHENNNQARGFCHTYPYISWKLCIGNNGTPGSFPTCSPRNRLVRIEVLYALGLTLIELCFGKTLAEMQILDDGDPSETMTELATAYRLCDAVYYEMGVSYGDAVRRCLYQPFDLRDMTLDNEELQGKVFDEIVTPLNNDLLNFNGGLRIR